MRLLSVALIAASFSSVRSFAQTYNLGAFWRQSVCRGVSLVQSAQGANVGGTNSTTTFSATLTPTSGNLLVIALFATVNGDNNSTESGLNNYQVSDSLGNTWNATSLQGATVAVQLWYSSNVTGGSPDTVTAVASYPIGTPPTFYMDALEYAGISSFDVTSGSFSAASTSTASTGPMTTTGGCDLVVALFGEGSSTAFTPVGSFTTRPFTTTQASLLEDNAAYGTMSRSSVNTTATISVVHSWAAVQAAFVANGYGFTAPAGPSKIAFTTSSQSLTAYNCSSAITFQSQNSSSVATNATSDITVNLSGSGTQFYSDPNCMNLISSSTIFAGTNSNTFYATFSNAASGTLTATPTNGFSAISQTETLSANAFVWVGGASCDGNWATGACWQGGAPPTTTAQNAHFDGGCSTNCSATLSANVSIGGIWLHSTMSSSATVSLGTYTLTLAGTLPQGTQSLIIDGGIFAVSSGTLTLNNNMRLTGGSWNLGSGTINIGAYNMDAPTGTTMVTYGTSTANLTGTKLFGAFVFYNVNVSGSTILENSETFYGNLVVNSGASLNISDNLTIGGNWTNNGTTTEGLATDSVTMNNSGSHTISGTTTPSIKNLVISGNTTLGVGLTVAGNVTLSATLSSAGYGISIGGNWTNNGTYTAGGSTVTFTPGANHVIGGSAATTFGSLTMNNSSASSANSLTFPASLTTTVSSTLTLSGNTSNELSLVSSSPGTQWTLTPPASTTLGGYLSVKDSDSTATIHSGSNYTNAGNNTNWQFP